MCVLWIRVITCSSFWVDRGYLFHELVEELGLCVLCAVTERRKLTRWRYSLNRAFFSTVQDLLIVNAFRDACMSLGIKMVKSTRELVQTMVYGTTATKKNETDELKSRTLSQLNSCNLQRRKSRL